MKRSIIYNFVALFVFTQSQLCAQVSRDQMVNSHWNAEQKRPIIILDGELYHGDIKDIKIPPMWIQNITVVNRTEAIEKYGDIGINGAIEATTMFDKCPIFELDNHSPKSYIESHIEWREDYGRVVKFSFEVTEEGRMQFIGVEDSISERLRSQIEEVVNNAPKWHSVAMNNGQVVIAKGELYLHNPLVKIDSSYVIR